MWFWRTYWLPKGEQSVKDLPQIYLKKKKRQRDWFNIDIMTWKDAPGN